LETKPDSYYQGTRPEMLPFIPTGVDTVLEVGCAAGGFGRQLKARGVREVWGVEVVESAARRAREVLDRVLIGDVAELIDDLPAAYFDVVLFNDVLEHMVDPYTVLARIKSRIKPGGMVVSSIPNIRYYFVLREFVLHKRWEYEEQGILDKTHLRFFTVTSIRNMYEGLGYEILRHEGLNPIPNPPWSYRLANALVRGKIGDMRYEQFVTWARPIPAEGSGPTES
jgi:SAM-dependent methyltransferase